MTTTMNIFQVDGPLICYPVTEAAFKEWVGMVECEQACKNIRKNIIINRQILHNLWENGYSPIDALKDVFGAAITRQN